MPSPLDRTDLGNASVRNAYAAPSPTLKMKFSNMFSVTIMGTVAVGEVMMLGAYLYYAGAVTFGLSPWVAFVVTLVLIAAFAVAIERAVLRPLSGQSTVSLLMATIGIASILHGGVEAGATIPPTFQSHQRLRRSGT